MKPINKILLAAGCAGVLSLYLFMKKPMNEEYGVTSCGYDVLTDEAYEARKHVKGILKFIVNKNDIEYHCMERYKGSKTYRTKYYTNGGVEHEIVDS